MTGERISTETIELIGRPSLLVVVSTPVLFVVFGVVLPIGGAVGLDSSFEVLLGLLLAASGAAVYLVERQLMRVRRTGVASEIREIVVLLLANGLLVWGFLRQPLGQVVRGAELWTAVASVSLVWALVGVFRRTMARREFYVEAVARAAETKTPDRMESEAVAAATRDFSFEAGEAAESVTKCRRWTIFFIVWQAGVLVVAEWAMNRLNIAQEIGICFSVAVALYDLVVLGRMREDQRLLAEGLMPTKKGVRIKSAVSGSIFAAAGTASLLFALRTAFIPRSALESFFAWIVSLLARIPSPTQRPFAPSPISRALPKPPRELSDGLAGLPSAHGSEILAQLLGYLGWTLLALLALAFLWLLVSPLFRLRLRRGELFAVLWEMVRQAGRSLTRSFRGLVEAVGLLIGLRHDRALLGTRGSVADNTRAEKRTRRRASIALFRAVFGGKDHRFRRAFQRFVSWGEQHGVPFSTAVAPKEYADLVGRRVPELAGELARIADLYEQHLFAPRPLSADALERYFTAIKGVIRHV